MLLENTREFALQKPFRKTLQSSYGDIIQILRIDNEAIGSFEIKKAEEIYQMRDLENNPILTVQKNSIFIFEKYSLTFEFYKGGAKDVNTYLGKLRSEESVNWLDPVINVGQVWFEDPNENKVLTMRGKNYVKFKILKDNKIVAEGHKKLFKNQPKGTYGMKISLELDNDLAMIVLGIALILRQVHKEALNGVVGW